MVCIRDILGGRFVRASSELSSCVSQAGEEDVAMASGAVMVEEKQTEEQTEQRAAVPVTTGYSALFGFNPHDDDADDF